MNDGCFGDLVRVLLEELRGFDKKSSDNGSKQRCLVGN
jgi:hypothetical protein